MVPFKGLSDFRTWIFSILQELNFCSEWHQNGKFKFLFNSTERLKIWETIIIDQLYTIFSLFHFAFNNIKKMIAVLSIAYSSSKRSSTLDAESQRSPEFLHVKSQCYLQKSPLFNPWHLVFGCFLIGKYTNSEK